MSTQQSTTPRASLSIGDGIAMMVGLIIGVGIFKLPQLVALNTDSNAAFLGLWVLGGRFLDIPIAAADRIRAYVFDRQRRERRRDAGLG